MKDKVEKIFLEAGGKIENDGKKSFKDFDIEYFTNVLIDRASAICRNEHWKIIAEKGGTMNDFDRGVKSGRKMLAIELYSKIKDELGDKNEY